MLNKLQKFDQRTRAGILAGLTQQLLPSPGFAEISKPQGVPQELYGELIEDMRQQLKLAPDDQSTEATRRLFAFLNDQLRKTLIKPSEIKGVKERVGDRGALRPDLYTIKFGDEFKDLSQTMGVTKEQATQIVQRARVVEHLLPQVFGQENGQAVSLFVENYDGSDPHSVLILAIRKKDILFVDRAWLMFHKDVDISSAKRPLDLLHALVEKYGVEIQVAGKSESKFLLYRSFEAPHSSGRFELIRADQTGVPVLDTSFFYRISPESFRMEVALAFAINVSKYAADLKNHGVKVTRQIG